MPAKQCKYWPFTWFPDGGATDEMDEDALLEFAKASLALCNEAAISQHLTYFVAQAEICPTTKRLHIQGYIELKERWTFHRVQEKVFKAYLPSHVHCTAARGTAAQNRAYCTKDDSRVPGTDPVEVGEPVGDGGATHQPGKALDRIYADIKAGFGMQEIVEKYGFSVWCHHNKSLDKAMMIWGKKRLEMPRIILLIGPSGSGKSMWAQRNFPDRYRWTFGNGGSSSWMDGYNGEPVVELSEFRGQLPLSFMLDLLDRYECKAQVKGGTVQVIAHTFIITSNDEPDQWYKGLGEDRDEKLKPLLRRLAPAPEGFGERPRYQTENRLARAAQ